MVDYSTREFRFPDGVPGLDADPILYDLARLPVLQLGERQIAIFERFALELLAQRQFVGLDNLQLPGVAIVAGPGSPTQFFKDVSGRLETIPLGECVTRLLHWRQLQTPPVQLLQTNPLLL